ncbi:MAG: hypothetical protein P9L99_11530 [Candidatus Lernaella stagnicola]|nr:hypothetical protein [Candidatus Lernaella stagnicola]
MADDFYPRGKGIGARLRLVGLLFVVIVGTTVAIFWIKGNDPLEGLDKMVDAIVNFFKAVF